MRADGCRERSRPRSARARSCAGRAWISLPAGPGFAAGTLLDARALGLAAAMGHVWLPVRRRPRVGLLATGNELRLPGETPEGSQIISSNTVTVGTMVTGWGAAPVDLGICPDDGEALAARVRDAAGLELLVTTGGASVGDYDLVQAALGREGLALDFWKIAMRPGKPLLFGRLGAVAVLGFPGNPVSSGVCAIVFLRMALQKLLGLPTGLPQRQMPARERAERQRPAAGLSARAIRRFERPPRRPHGTAAGQLDAGHVRRGRCPGGAPTVRSAPGKRATR